jgi:hypothetical protein
VRPPADGPLIADPSALPERGLPTRVVRLPGWWSPIDVAERYLAVNRVLQSDGTEAGAGTEAVGGYLGDEHHLLDVATGERRCVLPVPVSGDGWWSMARALSPEGWTVWEEVHGLDEDRWRLYGASFDLQTLELDRPRLLLEASSSETDRCHFAVSAARLVATTNSRDGDTSWGSRGWVVAIDLDTGARDVVYEAPVSVGDLCVAGDGTVAFVEYTDPDDVHSGRLVVLRLSDGEVLLRHDYPGGPVRAVAWDGENLAWEADQADEEAGGCYILLRTADGVVHHVYDDGIAPALSNGHLFLSDFAADGTPGSTLALRISDLAPARLRGKGDVAPPTSSSRGSVVTSWRDDDTIVRIGRVE